MTEVNNILKMNGLNIMAIIFISVLLNTIATQNWDIFISIINCFINLQSHEFWFLFIHIIIAYLLLVRLKIELGFHASIKFN
jgi:hypothetical protein